MFSCECGHWFQFFVHASNGLSPIPSNNHVSLGLVVMYHQVCGRHRVAPRQWWSSLACFWYDCVFPAITASPRRPHDIPAIPASPRLICCFQITGHVAEVNLLRVCMKKTGITLSSLSMFTRHVGPEIESRWIQKASSPEDVIIMYVPISSH